MGTGPSAELICQLTQFVRVIDVCRNLIPRGFAMPMTSFLGGQAFPPETLASMGIAFDQACKTLGLANRSDPLTAIVASKIIAAAHDGEREPDRLCKQALRALNSGTA
jgi:hypothetical protein